MLNSTNSALRRRLVHFPRNLLVVLVYGSVVVGSVHAQEYQFTTLAGSGGPGAIDGPSGRARFNAPQGVAVDSKGNVYVADSFNATIRKITPEGIVSTVAGLAPNQGSDDGTGADARFNLPVALVPDQNGNVYVADQNNHVLRKIAPDGLVITFAGNPGLPGAADGVGVTARFNFPTGLAIDPLGNLYVADTFNQTIRKVTPGAEVTTLAGSAGASGSQDDVGTAARFNFPGGIALGDDGTLYVADTGNETIRKISTSREVSTLAGSVGAAGSVDETGTAAKFNEPVSLAADRSGNIYVADSFNHTVRKVTSAGVVRTLAGDSTQPDLTSRPFISYADGSGTEGRFKYPYGVAVDGAGNVYVADRGNDAIRRITPGGVVSTLAGSSQTGSNDGPGSVARFRHPTGVAVDKSGSLFVVDGDNNTLRRITSNGVVSTIAGVAGSSGNVDGPASEARFTGPRKLALNSAGDLFVADTGNSTIRKLTRTHEASGDVWQVSTFAGQAGSPGFGDGIGTAAQFKALYDLAIDTNDNLFVADKDNDVIRKVSSEGAVTTLAGQSGVAGAADGAGDQAQFNLPYGITVDRSGFIFVADTLNHTIRKVTPDGAVTTLAGDAGNLGNQDGTGNLARFTAPYGVAADAGGNIFVADYFNNLIRKVTSDGVVTTIGGRFELDPEGFPLNGSSDGAGSAAQFYNPKDIAVDSAGTIYVADSFNNTIRVGTTNFCLDQPIVDRAVALVGQQRQLDTQPHTAVAWEWSLIRRPANSRATLSAENVRNPTFTPDVADTFIFQLRATNAVGLSCVRTLGITATKPPPSILASSVTSTNGQFSFTLQGLPETVVQVEVSDDLTHWLAVGTFVLETATFSIVDSSPAGQRGFYRLRQL